MIHAGGLIKAMSCVVDEWGRVSLSILSSGLATDQWLLLGFEMENSFLPIQKRNSGCENSFFPIFR